MSSNSTQYTIMMAFITLVAKNGFHGTSMSMVAKEAGVAIGTSYVHYASKEELVNQTYIWIKHQLADHVVPKTDLKLSAKEIYEAVWMSTYEYFSKNKEQAQYISQIEESPYFKQSHEQLEATGNPLTEILVHPNLADALIELPLVAFGKLSIGVAISLAASNEKFSRQELSETMSASWRAISKKTKV